MSWPIIILATIVLIPVAVSVWLIKSRKLMREAKNYERAFKMVTLLIHLPPISDDIDSETRDARDVADENVSRATTMYNLLASINKKGFKTKIYGQRHIGIEVVATKGFVNFYISVPLPMIPIVEQAITSAYPSTRLEEVPDHNIFSPVGKISGTVGGEVLLKEDYAYPVANYQEIKRDTMQSLLNSLSGLKEDDGVGIQILLRPAQSEWIKHAKSVSSKKRKGNDKKSGALDMLKMVATAPTKPPESKGDEQKPLSSLDQAIVDSIDEKTRSAGFEVLIRVVVSSPQNHRSLTLLNSVFATFSLYDSPGRNGFKYSTAKDIEKFVQGYILRMFPQENNKNILNTTELATLFHFPDQKSIPTTQLERQQSKQTDGPRNVSDRGIVLGYNVFRGTKKRINLDPEDRRRHVYIIGQTGVGKSVLLENCAVQDMLNGDGFCFIDPHGDTVEKLMGLVPKERTEDIIYFCPSDMDYPMGLNIFEFHKPEQKDFLVQEAINMLYKLYDPQRQGIIGPRYEHLFRNAAMTVMAGPDPNVTGGTLVDIPKLFNDKSYVAEKLQYVTDQVVLDFWQKEMPASERSNDFGEVKSWFISKFGAFLSNIMMRNIIGQTKSAFNLREVMDQKKILFVNLSKGKTGELNSKLLGMIFVMQFQAAAMSRSDVDASQRPDFCLYVDEFQNYSTDSFATILSEARKFGLNLVVANQFTTQLTDEIRDAVFGNVGTIISFRVGTQDAEALEKIMQPIFDSDDLQRVPNANMVVRTLVRGIPTQPFSMQALPYIPSNNKKLEDALKKLSAAKYGRPRAQVEAELVERLSVKEPTQQSATNNAPEQPNLTGLPNSAQATSPLKQPSFLDDWLAKRSKAPITPSTSTPTNNVPGNGARTQDNQKQVTPPSSNPDGGVSIVNRPVKTEDLSSSNELSSSRADENKVDEESKLQSRRIIENKQKDISPADREPGTSNGSLADQLRDSVSRHKKDHAHNDTSTPHKGKEGELSHNDTLQIRN